MDAVIQKTVEERGGRRVHFCVKLSDVATPELATSVRNALVDDNAIREEVQREAQRQLEQHVATVTAQCNARVAALTAEHQEREQKLQAQSAAEVERIKAGYTERLRGEEERIAEHYKHLFEAETKKLTEQHSAEIRHLREKVTTEVRAWEIKCLELEAQNSSLRRNMIQVQDNIAKMPESGELKHFVTEELQKILMPEVEKVQKQLHEIQFETASRITNVEQTFCATKNTLAQQIAQCREGVKICAQNQESLQTMFEEGKEAVEAVLKNLKERKEVSGCSEKMMKLIAHWEEQEKAQVHLDAAEDAKIKQFQTDLLMAFAAAAMNVNIDKDLVPVAQEVMDKQVALVKTQRIPMRFFSPVASYYANLRIDASIKDLFQQMVNENFLYNSAETDAAASKKRKADL